MIDKYEGHTPAPWRFGKQGATHSEDGKTAIIRPYPQLESIGGEDKVTLIAIHHGDATSKDLKLMVDAPLLLEEVKRLREGIEDLLRWKTSLNELTVTKLTELIE